MKFIIKLVSDEVENFVRQYEIDTHATFFDFREAILDSVGYSHDEIDSFFICDDGWDPRQEIVAFDMGSDSAHDVYIMSSTRLSEFLTEEGQHILFMFDPVMQRCFYMELKSIEPGKVESGVAVTGSSGKAPAQHSGIDFDDMVAQPAAGKNKNIEEFDSKFYGDSDYNEDELRGGFDDMNFN